jgi:hypothetical protein
MAMKWTSWAVLGFFGSLMFLVLFVKDREIFGGIDRLSKVNGSRLIELKPDADLKSVSENSPYMRTER